MPRDVPSHEPGNSHSGIHTHPKNVARANTAATQNCTEEADRRVDVLILGAGAAGLMCAREAANAGLRVALLERGPLPGRKLAVSGGGKANFTNRKVCTGHYRCDGAAGSDFCAPALKAFTPEHMVLPQQAKD